MYAQMYGNHPYHDAIPEAGNRWFPSDICRTDAPNWLAALSPHWKGSVIMLLPNGYRSEDLQPDSSINPLKLICFIYEKETEQGMELTISKDAYEYKVIQQVGEDARMLHIRALQEAEQPLALGLLGTSVFLLGDDVPTTL